jgi:hypothetical protein
VLAGLSTLALLAHVVLASGQMNPAVVGLALPPAFAITNVTEMRSNGHA